MGRRSAPSSTTLRSNGRAASVQADAASPRFAVQTDLTNEWTRATHYAINDRNDHYGAGADLVSTSEMAVEGFRRSRTDASAFTTVKVGGSSDDTEFKFVSQCDPGEATNRFLGR